jgi:hypothetical protein
MIGRLFLCVVLGYFMAPVIMNGVMNGLRRIGANQE